MTQPGSEEPTADPLDELARLAELTPAPGRPPDWSSLGYEAPADYRRLVDTYGEVWLDDLVEIYGPDNGFLAYNYVHSCLCVSDRALEDLQRYEPRPARLKEGEFSLFAWGATDDGRGFYWVRPHGTAPEEWTIAVQHHSSDRSKPVRWTFHGAGTVEFLLTVLREGPAA